MQSSYPYTQAQIKLMKNWYESDVEKGEGSAHMILHYVNSMKRKEKLSNHMHQAVIQIS